ncbi:MAG: hypothetical protein M1133_15745 [Armatimonadetes bacterium]|nr:hypothetical protein [Armatimonadota bacterium]
MPFVEFIVLLLIIVFAAYLLSRGAEVLAGKWGCNIVGSIVLALVTTLPEYAFVYWASMKGQYQMAIGSAIGACTLLITLGYGLVIWLATSKLSRHPVKEIRLSKHTRIDAFYLLVTGIVAFVFIWWDDALSLVEAIALALIFAGYVYQVFRAGASDSDMCTHEVTKRQIGRGIVELLIGGVIVYLASEPFVDSMIHIARMWHVSPVLIAIVLGPIASEMPEKLTAYMVVLKNGRNAELSICNFIGSKVNHNSLLLAVMPFVAYHKHGTGAVRNLMSPTFVTMTVLTVLVSALLVRGRLQKWQGITLVGAYVVAMALAMLSSQP